MRLGYILAMLSMEFRHLSEHQYPFFLMLEADPSLENINSYIESSYVIGCFSQNKLCGVVTLTPSRPKVLEVSNIAVEKDFRGKGLGKMLLKEAIEYAKKNNFHLLEIGTGNSSLTQLSLYQKVGFRITGIIPNYFIEKYPDKIIENEIWCRDMVRLSMDLVKSEE